MSDGAIDLPEDHGAGDARARAYAMPLDQIDVADPALFQADAHWPYFERLRAEDPVHYCAKSEYGPYWSITRYNDIMTVDTTHQAFSSDSSFGGITIRNFDEDFVLPMFIAMDPPKHDIQRKTVSPIVSPANLAMLEGTIRERVGGILDGLPIGETFDWVDKVSIELTTQMLATLFDFPWEERRKLTRWSDVTTAVPGAGIVDSEDQRRAELLECLAYFTELWNQRVNSTEPGNDLISMLAHGEATRNMPPFEYLGNILLLIVGGNDTTRNSITGGLLALSQNPAEETKLRADPSLIPNMVSEIIRWQTPLAYMRRTAVADFELSGKTIRKGDKVVMWYVSGNRDETVIENPNAFLIDRPQARRHLSFGFGIHRCVGNRLAELQLKIIWEEILARFPKVEVMGEPKRVYSSFVKGYESLPVRIPGRL
jgi:cytochrome P450